eukprot:2587558-Alexandrium_andersonii.AAC.1
MEPEGGPPPERPPERPPETPPERPWRLECLQCQQVVVTGSKPRPRPGAAGWPFAFCPGCNCARR